MSQNFRSLDSLGVKDLMNHSVWEYAPEGADDETEVRPVESVPVNDLSNRIVGTEVSLANGSRVWATVGNVDSEDARATQQFLTLAVVRDGAWFLLARYHDFYFDIDKNGPAALAKFLNLSIAEVFPISYDIRRYVKGESASFVGHVTAEPRERLSEAEVIKLALR